MKEVKMDLDISVDEFKEMLDSDEVRIANVPKGRYFVHRDGYVISLNKNTPQYVEPVNKLSGQVSIILYTPNLKAFDLGSLVISSFYTPEDSKQGYIFINEDITDCRLSNLQWADTREAEAAFRKSSFLHVKSAMTTESVLEPKLLESKKSEPLFSLPEGIVDVCVPNSDLFSGLLISFANSLKRFLHSHTIISYEDEFIIRLALMSCEHMSQLSQVPVNALFGILEQKPEVASASIIFDHMRFRIKSIHHV